MPALAQKISPFPGIAVPVKKIRSASILPDALSGNHKAKVANSDHLTNSHNSTPPSLHEQHERKRTPMSLGKSSNEFDLGKRLADALRKRIFADRAITIKQLAYAIQSSEQTIWNWLNGSSQPKGQHLMKLIMFFDESFANELFAGTGATIVKMDRAKNLYDAIQRFHEAVDDIRKIGG